MLTIEKSEGEKKDFFDQFEKSMNNVYLCCDMNISNNITNSNNNIYPIYTLEKKIQKHKLIKIQKVIHSEYNNTKPCYDKEIIKNNKEYYKKYIEANCKKILNYKKLI